MLFLEIVAIEKVCGIGDVLRGKCDFGDVYVCGKCLLLYINILYA